MAGLCEGGNEPPGSLKASTLEGFIPECLLVFKSKKTNDYHEEINHATFYEWFENKVLKNLNAPSTITMDNAPYHSVIHDKAPTMATKKADMIAWLLCNNVTAQYNMRKAELMELVARNKP
ncbi:hypothetical protein ANN_17773 [Periplaneta americana]|uniref:Uncharacterized protein n=1 Tax=Periplaneta americana TaxID=6978 RepID=A0ABQ8SUU3_PERAM|nr:hypothetical protein ANN_17773 [Periplaneta americana]